MRSPRALLPFFLANLLAQHSGIVPAEAQLRIRGVTTEHPQRFGALRIVVQEDVPFLAFDQGEYVDVVVHFAKTPFGSGRGVADSCWGLSALWVGGEWLAETGRNIRFHDEPQHRLYDVLSAIRPAPHHSRFTCATARREHFAMCM